MPMPTASAVVPASAVAAPARFTVTFPASAVAVPATVIAPELSITSLPSPPQMPAARASARFSASESAYPTRLTVTAVASAWDTASAAIAAVLPMVSFPPPPSIPMAVALARVFSLHWSPAKEAPMPLTETATVSASAWAKAVIEPLFEIVSWPAPPAMPVPCAVAVELTSEAEAPATTTVTPVEAVAAVALASIEAVLLIRSLPSPPAMPVAAAVAVVPPSQIESMPPATPASVADTMTVLASALELTLIAPVLVMWSSPSPPSMPKARASAVAVLAAAPMPARVTETATAGVVVSEVPVIAPLLTIVSSPEPPLIPANRASPDTPLSQTSLALTEAPAPESETATPTAVASAEPVMSPWLWMRSAPSPPSMPVARASTEVLVMAAVSPAAVKATSTDTVLASAVTRISPVFRTVSSPEPASIPLAIATALVPLSHTASVAPESPRPVNPAATPTPDAEASATISAVLSMMSLPAPPSIPVARAVVVEVVAATAIPLPVMATSTATVSASAIAVMAPTLRMISSPSPVSMPLAAAVVSVPPSQTASAAPDTPAPVMPTATATPVAEASAVIAPSL